MRIAYVGTFGASHSTETLRRLYPKFRIGDGCWPWVAGLDAHGYGQFRLDGRTRKAHHIVYEWLIGPVPDGLSLGHLCHDADTTCDGGSTCRHRACVRPDHLEPMTRGENVKRSGRIGLHARGQQRGYHGRFVK